MYSLGMPKKLFGALILSLFYASAALAGWSQLTSNTTSHLNAVFFVDKDKGYVVASAEGIVLKTITAGAIFAASSQGTTTFNDVVFASATEGYLLGQSGATYKTTNEGASYTLLTLPAALATAHFRNGSASGNRRAFAAYASPTSYLYFSTDGGASFTTEVLASGYEIYGVVLTEDATWEWGNASGTYVIRKNGLNTTNQSQKINRVFFTDKDNGFAVGNSGLFLKTTNGGSSWTSKTTAGSQNLNAASFISSLVGWVVGDGGTVLSTKDGGDNFLKYPSNDGIDATINLNDVDVKTTTVGGVLTAFVYAVGQGGNIYKLNAPTVAAIAPASRFQGWVGTVEVSGANYLSGATLSFGGSGITVFTTEVSSTTKIKGLIIIDPLATVGGRDVTVTNPDLTSLTTLSAFTVTANPKVVSLSNIRFDGNLYQLPPLSIVPTPVASFDVSSTVGTITAATLNAKILFYQSGQYKKVLHLPASSVTIKSTTSANINYTFDEALTAGAATLEIYAENSAGNVSREVLSVVVGGSTPSPGAPPLTGAKKSEDLAVAVPATTTWNGQAPMLLQVKFKTGYAPSAIRVVILTGPGGDVALNKVYPLSVKAMAGVAGKANITIEENEIAQQYRRAGIMSVQVLEHPSGTKIGSGKIVLVPWKK
jgi:photosystem II stability/assembly factor-like uncharacterized protein